jgi:transcriptional regulator NrdR family protein
MSLIIYCPRCKDLEKAMVIDSRPHRALGIMTIKRRRECLACRHRWTTYELPVELLENFFKRVRQAISYHAIKIRDDVRNILEGDMDAKEQGLSVHDEGREDGDLHQPGETEKETDPDAA